jgi:hypothetical protein
MITLVHANRGRGVELAAHVGRLGVADVGQGLVRLLPALPGRRAVAHRLVCVTEVDRELGLP